MGADPGTDLDSEIARLLVSIDRMAAATGIALGGDSAALQGDDSHSGLTEHKELCRQLAALRERVVHAESQHHDDPPALRAELATLLFFAKTLLSDADTWRTGLVERAKEAERETAAARQEQERLATEREELVRRRDALQRAIDQTAKGLAQRDNGEARRTLPVITLVEGFTVCSMTVSIPRKGVRPAKRWLVTLNESRDQVLVRSA
jgi:chromosome segregation ATPase